MNADQASDISYVSHDIDEELEQRSTIRKCWDYIVNGRETLSEYGVSWFDSGDKDLKKLKEAWVKALELSDEEKSTVTLHATNLMLNIMYPLLLLVGTLVSFPLKFAIGTVVLLLTFDLQTIVERWCDTLWRIISQSGIILYNKAANFFEAGWKLVKHYAKECWESIKRGCAACVRKVMAACEKLQKCFKPIWEKIKQCFKSIWEKIKACVNNIAYSIYYVLEAVASLVKGGVNLVSTVLTVILLATAALFFETGISNIVAGITKFLSSLTEGLAAALGVGLDSIADFFNNLSTAGAALCGERPKVANQTAEAGNEALLSNVTDDDIEQGRNNFTQENEIFPLEIREPGVFFAGPCETKNKGCRKALHGTVHDFNSAILDCGISIEKAYYYGKQVYFQQHSATVEQEPRIMNLTPMIG